MEPPDLPPQGSRVLRSVVTGVGGYLPDRIVTNDELSTRVDTSDEWIRERTGIRQRRQAADDQPVSDLAVEAARRALAAAGRTPEDVDLIVVATTTPDLTFPAVATIVQRKLGCPVGIAFDVQAVCSGFVYALSVADGFVARNRSKCALVIGAETMTRLMDWTDRGTCVLFGDGAGCVVVEPGEGEGTTADRGLLGFALRADGTKQELLYVDGGVSTTRSTGYLRMQGNQVFRHAVVNISEAVTAAAADAGVEVASVDWFIPHQANQRILEGVARRLGIDEAKVISTVAEHANTSAASIPLALDQGLKDGRIQPGQLLLMEAMGGGLTWGACVLRL
jgi:3-oxoacyl-[acyl-carrier-protein] synthase-3